MNMKKDDPITTDIIKVLHVLYLAWSIEQNKWTFNQNQTMEGLTLINTDNWAKIEITKIICSTYM